MSEDLNTQEVINLVERAQAKGTFDIAAFAKGRALPQDTVTAYLNVDAAYKLDKINKEINLLLDDAEIEKLQAKAQELAKEVIASKIVFDMRGISQEEIVAISKECDENFPAEKDAFNNKVNSAEWLNAWTISLVAANIVRVTNADGEVDERVFSYEDGLELYKHLPKEVWDLLVEKMEQLTLASAYFKGMTDAGFLPKS